MSHEMVELYDFAFCPSWIAIPWSETATPKKAQIRLALQLIFIK